ncbi:UNVERIFIED_CONTAM: hypothetical protein FKN15_021339 [Acipenser sinensis]
MQTVTLKCKVCLSAACSNLFQRKCVALETRKRKLAQWENHSKRKGVFVSVWVKSLCKKSSKSTPS